MKLTRRAVGKGLAVGTAAGLSGLLCTESSMQEQMSPNADEISQRLAWRQLYPGIWRARLGVPERITPVSTRLVPPQTEAFAKLPRVEAAPLAAIQGRRTGRGCMVQLPLRPNERIFGLGLQFLSFDQRGKKKVTRVNADPKLDTGDSHAPIPTLEFSLFLDVARYFQSPDAPAAAVAMAHQSEDGESATRVRYMPCEEFAPSHGIPSGLWAARFLGADSGAFAS